MVFWMRNALHRSRARGCASTSPRLRELLFALVLEGATVADVVLDAKGSWRPLAVLAEKTP
jgi:hypothetical protein